MGKYYGIVGYVESVETAPGVWTDKTTERTYIGDTIRNVSRWSSSSESINDNLSINNRISIIADPFAYQNFHHIKYVEFMGTKWKVESVEVESPPRILLTLGGEYNGK